MRIECSCGLEIGSNLNDTEHEEAATNIKSILRAYRDHLEDEHDTAENLDRAIQDLEMKAAEGDLT